jgi:hypothetical protein
MERPIRDYVEYVVDDLGLPKHLKGYRCAVLAIEARTNDPDLKMMAVYHTVSKQLNITPAAAERNLRHMIEWLFKNGNERKIDNYFGSSLPRRRNLSNNQFIATMAIAATRAKREVDLYANYRR